MLKIIWFCIQFLHSVLLLAPLMQSALLLWFRGCCLLTKGTNALICHEVFCGITNLLLPSCGTIL